MKKYKFKLQGTDFPTYITIEMGTRDTLIMAIEQLYAIFGNFDFDICWDEEEND